MLEISGLSKQYRGSSDFAVEGLSLKLNPGEVVGFLGANGAGKTTAIKCMTGVLPFFIGDIKINGISMVTDAVGAKKNIGYVADNYAVYDKLTGRQYINFLADIYGVSLEDRTTRLDDFAKRFDLTSKLDNPIKSYSHGMKQKISVIGALIHNPKVWILDEPLTGLDPQSALELKMLMREHCDNGNVVFFSSHIIEVVEKLCDRVAIIKKGKLVAMLDIDEIKAKQKDMNLEDLFFDIVDDKKDIDASGTIACDDVKSIETPQADPDVCEAVTSNEHCDNSDELPM